MMANILVNIEHGIEVAAGDVLKFLTNAEAVSKKAGPGVIAALGVLLGATETALNALTTAAAAPLNITLDAETITDLRAVWPDVVSFAEALGIKL
jgi:hypothetical protein